MSAQQVASRYAKAFLDVLGDEKALKGEVESFTQFCGLVSANEELSRTFNNASIKAESKGKVVNALSQKLNLSKTVTNFLNVLAVNGRLPLIAAIGQAVEQQMNDRLGFRAITLTTAEPVTDQEANAFAAKMEKVLGAKVKLQTKTDASLIAGGIAQVGSTVFDGSVRGQLNRMRRELVKEK